MSYSTSSSSALYEVHTQSSPPLPPLSLNRQLSMPLEDIPFFQVSPVSSECSPTSPMSSPRSLVSGLRYLDFRWLSFGVSSICRNMSWEGDFVQSCCCSACVLVSFGGVLFVLVESSGDICSFIADCGVGGGDRSEGIVFYLRPSRRIFTMTKKRSTTPWYMSSPKSSVSSPRSSYSAISESTLTTTTTITTSSES